MLINNNKTTKKSVLVFVKQQQIIQMKKEPTIGQEEDLDTPLHLAAAFEDDIMCKLLLEHGADPTIRSNGGFPEMTKPPFRLVKNNQVLRVFLMNEFATNCSKDCLKKAMKEKEDICESLYLNDLLEAYVVTKENVLQEAAEYGYEKCCQFVLDQEVDVNTVDKNGMTPLLHAVINGHRAICKLLLNYGANPEACINEDSKSYYKRCSAREHAISKGMEDLFDNI